MKELENRFAEIKQNITTEIHRAKETVKHLEIALLNIENLEKQLKENTT